MRETGAGRWNWMFVAGMIVTAALGASAGTAPSTGDGPRFAVREATATKGAIEQAAAEGTAADLTRFLDALTASAEGSLASAGAGTAIARQELATILKEQSLADSGIVDRLDPQRAKLYQTAGVSTVVTISVTGFSAVKELLEVEGRFGKTKAERWNVEATGIARAYNTTSGALIGSAKFTGSEVRTDEPISGTVRNTTPLTRVINAIAQSASGTIATTLAPVIAATGTAAGAGGTAGSGTAGAGGPGTAGSPAETVTPTVLLIARINAADFSPAAHLEWQSVAAAALTARGYRIALPDESIFSMTPSEFNAKISSSTTIANLAQAAQADALMIATVDSLVSDHRTIADPNVATAEITQWTLGGSWRLISPTGASFAGGTANSQTAIARTQTLTETTDVRSTLLRDEAAAIAQAAAAEIPRVRAAIASSAANNTLQLVVVAADLGIPDARLDKSGGVHFTNTMLPVVPEGATVLVDGIAVGNAPGSVTVTPGLHRIRIEHPFFEPWEQPLQTKPGMTLVATMKVTPAAWAQWRERVVAIEEIKRIEQNRIESALDQATARDVLEKSADAELIKAKGLAEFLRQSKLNLDTSGVEVFAPGSGGLDIWVEWLRGASGP